MSLHELDVPTCLCPCFKGYYHENYVVWVNEEQLIVRIPIPNVESADLRIIPEAMVLLHLSKHHFPAPRLLAQNSRYAIHSFIEGEVLEDKYPHRTPLPDWIADNLARQMQQLHKLSWGPLGTMKNESRIYSPHSSLFFTYSCRFLRDYYDGHIHHPQFARKFSQVFPTDPFAHVPHWQSLLTDRAFVIGHCDIHRKNLIMKRDELVILDWELTLITDPCYDIALHFHKMHYRPYQEIHFLHTYLDLPPTHPQFRHYQEQIQIYRNIEWIKSAMVDLVRYSERFSTLDPEQQAQAVCDYQNKLNLARKVLDLPNIADPEVICHLLQEL